MKGIKIFAVMIITLSVFCAAACAGNGYSYWEIEPYTYENGEQKEFFVMLTVDNPKKSFEVWVNVDGVEGNSPKISTAAGFSETSIRYKTADIYLTDELLKQANGWIKINEGVSTSYYMIEVGTKNKMHINEIVACDSDGNIYGITLTAVGERIKRDDANNNMTLYRPSDSGDSTSVHEYFTKPHGPLCTLDEQSKFNRKDVEHFSIPSSGSN